MIVVHVTHEAVEKIGGIGSVIAGLVTTDAYGQSVSRTILLGPLLHTDEPVNRRLGEGGQVIYSSMDAMEGPPWSERFRPIERTHDVNIIYGTRKITEPCASHLSVEVEVLLVDVFHINHDVLNLFKADLHEKFGIPCDRFEAAWEFEQYIRLAEPGYKALKAIGVDSRAEDLLILAHEYMGMPTALRAILDGQKGTTTVFYAHEVASVREIVEKTPGHDTMFYNVLDRAREDHRTVEEIFPTVFANYKHPLVKAARYCDEVFAVGDYIEHELRALDGHSRTMDIDLVYNGIPSYGITLADKKASRERMRVYAETLIGYKPTWTFTHVARPVLSKGVWRDLGVLKELEPLLDRRGETAVYFMLGTLGGQRRQRDILQMERVYGWPVAHERGYPDLCGGEEVLAEMFDPFNRDHRNVRVILVNQFGWSPEVCGHRMPQEMTFADIRIGSDVELGLSVYEPFGISQLEPLCFGALCVASNVCGCMGFARRVAAEGIDATNIIEGNFLGLAHETNVEQLLNLPIHERDRVEADEFRRLAGVIVDRLPRDDAALQRLIDTGSAMARRMSWEHVVQEYFLPSLGRAAVVT